MIVKRYVNGKPVITTELDAPISPPPIPLETVSQPTQKKIPEKTKVVNSPSPSPAPAKKGCGCGRK